MVEHQLVTILIYSILFANYIYIIIIMDLHAINVLLNNIHCHL